MEKYFIKTDAYKVCRKFFLKVTKVFYKLNF